MISVVQDITPLINVASSIAQPDGAVVTSTVGGAESHTTRAINMCSLQQNFIIVYIQYSLWALKLEENCDSHFIKRSPLFFIPLYLACYIF